MKKRLISLLLVICLLLTVFPVAALADSAGEFRDVKSHDWYCDAVRYVSANGLFSGVSETEFDPAGTMTRGMFVTVLGRMAGVEPAQYYGLSEFEDVAADAYYAPYVAWACRYGITNGTGEGVFSPDLPIDRQQLACFFVRYFEVFGVEYAAADAPQTQEPADLEQVADWARDAVLQMWSAGILMGDGVNFDPTANASRAQAAMLCTRLDHAVEVWYKEPGVPSERVAEEPAQEEDGEEEKKGTGSALERFVRFYDGERLIEEVKLEGAELLESLPAVEKSSKENAVLLGYYYDEEFTEPFHTEDRIDRDTNIYAKYRQMESIEELSVRTFTLMEQEKDLEFVITRSSEPVSGEANAAKIAAAVESRDGSDPVDTQAQDNGDGTYTIYAPEGYRDGCAYTMTLDDGWIFAGKEASIRTASFTIAMEEVENLRMGDEIIYIADTDAMDYLVAGEEYAVLTSRVLEQLQGGEGFFPYDDSAVEEGDIVCIYTGVHPEERENNGELLDPVVYVKVTEADNDGIWFSVLDEQAQKDLYEIPDNFPIRVTALPAQDAGTITLADLDVSMYESMLGKEQGTLEQAREKLSVGDYVTLYVSDAQNTLTGSEEQLYFGRVDAVNGDEITYTHVTRQDVIDSMDLNAGIDLTAEDLLDESQMEAVREQVLYQVERSGFAEEAADTLLDAAMSTEQFRADPYARRMLVTDEGGSVLSARQLQSIRGSFSRNHVDLDVQVGSGSRYGGVSIIIGVDADFSVEAEDGTVEIHLSAEFEEEVMIAPGVQGELVYKEILGIPVPVGVYIKANVDVKNFTAFSFDAQITTKDDEGGLLNVTSVSSELDEVMNVAEQTGISEEYDQYLQTLMERYNHMLSIETDWIQLVEQEIFKTEVCYYGIVIGVSTDFVVRADMSIAIGSSLSYEVGKRYIVWFKIGLFTPTAGTDTIDLIDEQFAFRFYVLGKLGVKAGIKAKIYAGIGSGDVASVGLAAELGPYVKLWGLFIYDYTRTRPIGSDHWVTSSHMMGGLNLEFGLYFILSFEAEALGLFEYSYDFLDEEYPLLETGESKYYYRMSYDPKPDEQIFIWDEDRDRANGITMELPQTLRVLDCVNLKNGVLGTDLLGYENFAVSFSNSRFTFDEQTGKVSVSVPENYHYMTCDATVTYLHGKAAFSNYDISVTVPLVWTDLSYFELQEFYTATVRVGNVEDGYERVWSTQVRRGEAFDLPTDAQIRELVNWNDLKYSDAEGYEETQTTGLTITQDTLYTYEIVPQTYEITVDGIQNADGSIAEPRTYTAKYGQVFDFSDLEETGTDDEENGIYTAFANVTTDVELPTMVQTGDDGSTQMVGQPMDLTLPITGAMAQMLRSGDVWATANYVDDSTTAVFTFNGLTHEDVTVTLRKGTVPSMDAVEEILEEEIRQHDGQPLGISEVYPVLAPTWRCTNYTVTCTGLSGARADIIFDVCGGYAMDSMDKLVGSLIVNIPDAARRGYTFRGWFTGPEGAGQSALTQTVPEDGITLYALWTPNTYCASFHLNGGDGNVPDPVLVTYDDLYENGNVRVSAPETEAGYTKGEAYGDLPVPTYTGYKFLGWSTMADRKDADAERVEETTVADIYDSDHVLYAQWKKLETIPQNVFVFGSRQTTVYNGNGKTATYHINTNMQYNDEDYYSSNYKYFTEELLENVQVSYKRDGILSEWESSATKAGVYDVKITRPADGNFSAFTGIYYGVLEVEKAPSSMNQTPTAACIEQMYYGNLVMNPDKITNYHGDGAVEFAVTSSSGQTPSESDWTSGVIYNGDTSGSFYLWTRLSEGENYKASNGVCSSSAISRTGEAPGQLISDDQFWYLLQVTTSSTDKSGTDSEVYAAIGSGGRVLLNQEDENDHERGDSRYYTVTMGNYLPNETDSVPVTISLVKKKTAPGWKLGSLQLHLYKKSGNGMMDFFNDISKSPALSSNKLVIEEWFLTDDYPRSSKTYTLTGLGRDLVCDVSGPTGNVDVTKGGTVEMAISHTITDENRNISYNGWTKKFAPEFTASFEQDKGFNKYLDWYLDESSGRWVCTLSCSQLRAQMEKAGIYQLTLKYGVKSEGLRTIYLTFPTN